ncbi:MAG TPA: sugar porter family MFS transporter [Thermoanaerobaculia bacterium]|nr:sugar porter family MFS transporter [Thermoanaerobaculia bacterium]
MRRPSLETEAASAAGGAPRGAMRFVLRISAVAATGGFLFGYDTAVVNGTVGALERHFRADAGRLGFAVAAALLGSALGAILAGRFADRRGRVPAMKVTALLFAAGSIGSGVAQSLGSFAAWRFLGGIAVGAASVVAPAYIAEVAPARVRGRLGSLQQLAIVTGIFLALAVNDLIAHTAGSPDAPFWFGVPAWRWMFWVEVLPSLVYGLGAFFVPESPRRLVAERREAEAAAVLARIGDPDVPERIREIRRTVGARQPAFTDLRAARSGLLPIVWVGVGLSIFQQFVGINVIFYYSTALWHSVGFTEADSMRISTITGVINIVTTLVAIASVDRFGRKPLLLAGSIGMTLTLGTMAWLFGRAPLDAHGAPVLSGAAGTAALVAANLYVFAFGFSWGPVVWVLLGEMFNNRIRGAALALAASAQWVANWLVTLTFPALSRADLGWAYGLYTGAAAASFLLVAGFVRETRGRTLEDM